MKPSNLQYFLGFLSLLISCMMIRLLPCSTISKMIHNSKKLCYRNIKVSETNIAWEAVRRLNFLFLGRVACFELSVAIVLFALFHRLSVTWCMGVKIKPFQSHAWIELDGKPFREDESIELEFKKMLVC